MTSPGSIEVAWIEKPWSALTVDELYAVMRLRQRVFVVEQTCPYLDADGIDPRCRHLWAVGYSSAGGEDEGPLGYLRIVPPGVTFAEASLGRIVTAPEARRTGIGRLLVAEGLRRLAAAHGAVPVRIGAQKYLERFYRELGFVRSSDDYDEDGIPHLEMLRT